MKRRYTLSLVISLAVYVAFGLIGIYTYRYFQSNDKKKVEPKIIKIKMIELKNEPQKEIVVEKQTQEVEQSEPKKMLKPINNVPQPLIEPLYPKVESKPKIEPKLPTPTPIVTPSVLTTQKPKSQTKEIVVQTKVTPKVPKAPVEVSLKSKTVVREHLSLPASKIEPQLSITPKIMAQKEPNQSQGTQYSQKQIDDWKIDFKNTVRYRIERHKKYPQSAIDAGITGIIRVSFDVYENGSVDNIEIANGNMLLQKAVRKAINDASPFKPSEKLKAYLPMRMNLPIEFSLEQE